MRRPIDRDRLADEVSDRLRRIEQWLSAQPWVLFYTMEMPDAESVDLVLKQAGDEWALFVEPMDDEALPLRDCPLEVMVQAAKLVPVFVVQLREKAKRLDMALQAASEELRVFSIRQGIEPTAEGVSDAT